MNIEIQSDFIDKAIVMVYNVSYIDYSLTLESKLDTISIDRITITELKNIRNGIDKYLKENGHD